jgi:hypothetical protein
MLIYPWWTDIQLLFKLLIHQPQKYWYKVLLKEACKNQMDKIKANSQKVKSNVSWLLDEVDLKKN